MLKITKCQRYTKDILKICQSYAKGMSEVIQRLQVKDNYLELRYAKDMPGVIARLQIQDNYLKQRYPKYISNIYQI